MKTWATITFTPRELATILCALRNYEDLFTEDFPHHDPGNEDRAPCEHHALLAYGADPLTEDEVSALCERIFFAQENDDQISLKPTIRLLIEG